MAFINMVNAEEVLCEYDLMKIFNDESEAREHATKNGLEMPKS